MLISDALTRAIVPSPADANDRRARMRAWMNASLFDRIGMHPVVEFDPQGAFYGSSLYWATARDYARFGILRKREAIVAERHGRAVGFALLEIASLGLNFSELTNAFTVHLLGDDREAQGVLVRAAKHRYGQLGRTHCVALEEGEQLGAFESAGFKKLKDYACWTFHRTHLEAMEEYFVSLFGSRRRSRT